MWVPAFPFSVFVLESSDQMILFNWDNTITTDTVLVPPCPSVSLCVPPCPRALPKVHRSWLPLCPNPALTLDSRGHQGADVLLSASHPSFCWWCQGYSRTFFYPLGLWTGGNERETYSRIYVFINLFLRKNQRIEWMRFYSSELLLFNFSSSNDIKPLITAISVWQWSDISYLICFHQTQQLVMEVLLFSSCKAPFFSPRTNLVALIWETNRRRPHHTPTPSPQAGCCCSMQASNKGQASSFSPLNRWPNDPWSLYQTMGRKPAPLNTMLDVVWPLRVMAFSMN